VATPPWVSDVQGNVYPGFRKDQQAFVLITFPDRAAGRRWLGELRPDIATCEEVEAFNRAFKLIRTRRGSEPRALRSVSATWINVALSVSGLQRLLGTDATARLPTVFRNNRVPWAEARDDDDVHALLLVASDRADDLATELARQREVLWGGGARELRCYRGAALGETPREHFGYLESAGSEPVLSGADAGQAGAFRREAARLGVRPLEVTASLLGRREGSKTAGDPPPFSHLGRAYPRWLPGGEAARRRILRRSIPYGAPTVEGEMDDGGRGLLFLAYQADLAGQFEHVWRYWLNEPNFPAPGAGPDGLVGQTGLPRAVDLAPPGGQRSLVGLRLPRFVTPRYGGYFFVPSIDALGQFARDRPSAGAGG
jgi:hypothetical protein